MALARFTPRVRYFLARSDVAGVVIPHGTDAPEVTAFFSPVTVNAGIPIVLTCAIHPASSLESDQPPIIVDVVTLTGPK